MGNSIHSKLEFIEKYGTNAFNKCRSTRRFIDSGKCAVRFCKWKNGKMNMGGVQQWFPPAYLGEWCRIVVNQGRSTSKLYEHGISDSDIIRCKQQSVTDCDFDPNTGKILGVSGK